MARRKKRFNPTLSAFGDIRATAEHYPAIFGDYDKDGIFDVDDPTPYKYSKSPDTIEEVKLSDEIRHLIDIRNQFESVKNQVIFDLEGLGGYKVYGRTKTPFSTINKLRRKRILGSKGLTDVAGTTVLAVDFPHLQQLKKFILAGRVGEVIEHENFYRSPLGGYRAHHFIIEREGLPVEIQLKTIRMADSSKAAHTPYKAGTLNTVFMDKLTRLANEADKGKKAAQVEFAKLTRDKKKLKEKLTIRKNTMARRRRNSYSIHAVKSAQHRKAKEMETTKHNWKGTEYWVTYDPLEKSYRTQIPQKRGVLWGFNSKDAFLAKVRNYIEKQTVRRNTMARRKNTIYNPHGEAMFNMHQIDEIRPLKSGGASLFKWSQGKMVKVGELTKDQFQEYQFSGGRRYQDGNWHTNPRRRRNARRPINPQSKRWTFDTFSKKYWGKDYRSVPIGIRKEFWSDFRYAFIGSLTKYLQQDEPYNNPRRRNAKSQHKALGARMAYSPSGLQTMQALVPYKSNSRRRRNSSHDVQSWAGSRDTSEEIAEAIFEYRKSPTARQRVWSEPTPEEMRKIANRAFQLAHPHETELYWGVETIMRRRNPRRRRR